MRLKNSCVAVFAVFTLFIAGCSNNLVGRVAGDGKGESTVTFSVTDIPANYAEMIRQAQNPATRSILPPTAPFTPTTPGLTFVLTGTSNSGKAIEETVTLSSTAPYTFKTTLGAYVWDLTLTAYKGPATNKLKVMEGHCTVDLTLGNAKPTFNMSIKGITTPGTVKVSGTVTDTDNICTHYEIGIYNLYSGKLIDKYTDVDGTTSHDSNAHLPKDQTPSGGSFTFNYGTTPTVTLNAGAYEYRMIFYKGTTPNFIPIGSYSDTIVVYPGYDLVKDIGTLDVLNKKPTKPEELRAYLVNGSEDKEPNYYYVQLTWKPSQFETNYELKLKTSSDDGAMFASSDEKVYGFNSTNTNAEDFLASAIRHDGSLAYGSTTCTLKLQLGKVYEVSLQAHNYIGDSDWVERTTADVSMPPADRTFIDFPTTTDPKKHINRRRIKYDLNGGKLILDAASPTPANTFKGTYIQYASYTGTAQPLLDIKPSTPTPAAGSSTLTRQSATTPPATLEWRQWLNPKNGQKVDVNAPMPPISIYQHENVFVKADFGFGLEGTVTPLPAPTDLPKDKIKITYDHEMGTTNTPIAESQLNSNHYPVPKLTGGKDTWITVELTTPADYTNLHCTAYFASGAGLLSKVDLQAVGNVCKFSTGDYTPQTFTLKVMAEETATHQMRSQTYIIDLH